MISLRSMGSPSRSERLKRSSTRRKEALEIFLDGFNDFLLFPVYLLESVKSPGKFLKLMLEIMYLGVDPIQLGFNINLG
jgi:hypothetical protein